MHAVPVFWRESLQRGRATTGVAAPEEDRADVRALQELVHERETDAFVRAGFVRAGNHNAQGHPPAIGARLNQNGSKIHIPATSRRKNTRQPRRSLVDVLPAISGNLQI